MSIKWNSIRLDDLAYGIVTKTVRKTLPGFLFCLSKTAPCAIISSQVSFKVTGVVVYPVYASTWVVVSMLFFDIFSSILTFLLRREKHFERYVKICLTGIEYCKQINRLLRKSDKIFVSESESFCNSLDWLYPISISQILSAHRKKDINSAAILSLP